MKKQPSFPVYRNYQYDASNALTPAPRRPWYRQKRLLYGLAGLVVVLLIAGLVLHWQRSSDTKKSSVASKAAAMPAGFNKQQYSLSDPTSLWTIVNKQRALNPIDYAPSNLITPNVSLRLNATDPEMKMRADAANALEQLFSDAAAQSIKLRDSSGYRSYNEQVGLYNQYVAQQGATQANRESAHPGHSEHQTGLAMDVSGVKGQCVVQQCFANMAEGQWVAANAYKYGFTLRYPKDKENITGYVYEPWHIRYVGKSLAAQLQQSGQTMEEFFGLPHVPLDS